MLKSQTITWKKELLFPKGCDAKEGFGQVAALLAQLDEHFGRIADLDGAGAGDLRLVCDEIASNIVRHAARRREIRMTVEVESRKGLVRMRIIDNGDEFNPFQQEIPYLGGDLEKRRVGGLGLYLVGRLFPLASYRRLEERNVTEVEYHLDRNGSKRARRSDDAIPE